jgi:hypothetical protein
MSCGRWLRNRDHNGLFFGLSRVGKYRPKVQLHVDHGHRLLKKAMFLSDVDILVFDHIRFDLHFKLRNPYCILSF